MNRWPSVRSPLSMPSMEEGTTSPSNTHRIRRSGRTQRRDSRPHFIDLGQGKLRTMASTISAMICGVGRPWRDRLANHTPSRSTSWSRVRPVERRKPSMAASGAPTRGPLRSSWRSACAAGSPWTTRVKRRGPANVVRASGRNPASARRSRAIRSRSRAAWACIRAGISSDSSSSSNWGMGYPAIPNAGRALGGSMASRI